MSNNKEQPTPTPEQRKLALQKILIHQRKQAEEKASKKK